MRIIEPDKPNTTFILWNMNLKSIPLDLVGKVALKERDGSRPSGLGASD